MGTLARNGLNLLELSAICNESSGMELNQSFSYLG